MSDRIQMIEERLQTALGLQHIEIDDQSALHAGHAGAKGGLGHFQVLVVSAAFAGKSLIQRHRLVYQALGTAMQTDIHALSIKALTPEEFQPTA